MEYLFHGSHTHRITCCLSFLRCTHLRYWLLIIPVSLEQLLSSIYRSSRFDFDHEEAGSIASSLHRNRDNLVQEVPSRETQVRTFRRTCGTTQTNSKLRSLTSFSREVEKRRTSLTSSDALEDTIRALTSTSLAARASKLGTHTLKNLWRLNNPFVSDSVELQQAYKQELMSAFGKTNGEAWTAIAHTVAQSLQPHLRRIEGLDGASYVICNVKDVSRDVTLAATLQCLFGIDNVAPELLSYIGNEIHRLTVGKKQFDAGAVNPDLLPQDLQRAADRLIDKLRDLFSEAKESSQLASRLLCSVSGSPTDFNPLNLVIPAFEAPWRAIYYTLLATLQSGPEQPASLVSLRDCMPDSKPPPVALAVAYESLRLYPPIRRVRRDHLVDIEAIQRDPKYWGPTAGAYDPSRFLDENGKIKVSLIGPGSAWMPFAVGMMKCPSAGGYSTRLILVIVGEVLRQLFPDECSPDWHLDGPEWDTSAKNGDTLRAGRDEYASVRVVVTSSSRNS